MPASAASRNEVRRAKSQESSRKLPISDFRLRGLGRVRGQELGDDRPPDRDRLGNVDEIMSVVLERRQQVIFDVRARRTARLEHGLGYGRREEEVVLRVNP